jgi:hypothetical protein
VTTDPNLTPEQHRASAEAWLREHGDASRSMYKPDWAAVVHAILSLGMGSLPAAPLFELPNVRLGEHAAQTTAELGLPKLGNGDELEPDRKCRRCGCSQFAPCFVAGEMAMCSWAEQDLCSSCDKIGQLAVDEHRDSFGAFLGETPDQQVARLARERHATAPDGSVQLTATEPTDRPHVVDSWRIEGRWHSKCRVCTAEADADGLLPPLPCPGPPQDAPLEGTRRESLRQRIFGPRPTPPTPPQPYEPSMLGSTGYAGGDSL